MVHLLHDCPFVVVLWQRLLPSDLHSFFNVLTITDWFAVNLARRKLVVNNILWSVLFGVTCWLIWKWRNIFIFEGKWIALQGCLNTIFSFATSVNASCYVIDEFGGSASRKNEVLVRWTRHLVVG